MDRRALNVLLAALELDQGALAQHMGYRAGYVTNVLNGCTPPSDPFRDAFGRVLADLMPGESPSAERMYPAAPLRKLIEKHAAAAMARSQFYADRGITCHGWNKRQHSSEASSTGCCALGVHPSSVYPEFVDCEEAS